MAPAERLSEPHVPSVPLDTEEERTFLQARLAQFGRVGALIGLVFLAIAVGIRVTMPLEGSDATIEAQLASTAIGALVWLTLRGRTRSERVLRSVDAVATLANCAVFIAMGWGLPLWARPDLLQVLCVTDILMLRAFLVPSEPRRTTLFSCVATVLILISVAFMYRRVRVNPAAPDGTAYVVVAGFLCFATVLLTTLTSKTIYGLRERVREGVRLGQYTLLEQIGEGGMGRVFKARHAMLRRPTAIKLLPVERAGRNNLVRFEREVQLTSELRHPNTVSIYDYGRTAEGVLYYAMEYLEGIDLETLVAIGGPQPPGRVVHLLRQIAGALDEAHGVGLIHRDVKPANVLVTARQGTLDWVKVLDFGLVKSVADLGEVSSTAVNQLLGTPLYMSPEAITTPDRIDARSDLYALGALGYFLRVGSPPFSAASVVEVCGHHLHTPPVAPFERLGLAAGTRLDALLLACLAKSPEQRPENAAAVLAALEACTDVPVWSAEQAHAWWLAHDAKIREARARRREQAPTPGSTRDLAVDVRARTNRAQVA